MVTIKRIKQQGGIEGCWPWGQEGWHFSWNPNNQNMPIMWFPSRNEEMVLWQESAAGGWSSTCQGPGAEMCLVR